MLNRLAVLSMLLTPLANAAGQHVQNVDYVGAKNPAQTLDLIVPADHATKKRPLVVFIHGGAWEGGDKRDGAGVLLPLAATGDYVVASINYRLTGEATWPAQMHDCKAAIRFLRAKAADYGIDPDRIGVVGMSAGGQLAAMLGTCTNDPTLEGTLGAFSKTASKVQCVVNFFGPTNFLTFVSDPAGPRPIQQQVANRLFGKNLVDQKEIAKLASPVAWITKDSAPFFTAHGTKDDLVPFSQATELDTALHKAGASSILVPVEGGGHGFRAVEVYLRARQFLDNKLRNQQVDIPSTPIRES